MVDDQTLVIVQTALKNCYKESQLNSLLAPIENVYERVSCYTGLPNNIICNVSKEMSETTELERPLLLESIKILLALHRQPTAKDVYTEFLNLSQSRGSKLVISFPVFLQKIDELEFKFRKLQNGQFIIMENPMVTFKRYHYLNKIKELRKTHKVFYYIDVNHFDNENKQLDANLQKYVHFFMVTSGGYEHGLFTNQVSNHVFKHWIIDILLPLLKPFSVIVLCSDKYLDKKLNITGYSSKAEMCQWLRNKNIPFDTSMSKAELFELIDKCVLKDSSHDIDRLFQSQGHEILHLPSSFKVAPSKLMYLHIMSSNNFDPGNKIQIKETVLFAINLINTEKWKNFEKQTIHFENEMYKTDAYIERQFDSVCKLDNEFDYESFSICNICKITNN